jgi:hypothetical protein
MNVRTVIGIIAGNVIFIASTLLLFYLARVDPHAPASPQFMLLAILYGVAFALLSGFLAGWISKRADIITGLVLACIIAVPAAITVISRPGEGAVWSQTATLFLMAPAALLGDWLRKNRQSS